MGASVSTPSPVIAASGTVSGTFYIGHGRLESIEIPSTWTAASISFNGSYDGSNFYTVKDNTGATISLTVTAGDIVTLGTIGTTAGLAGALWAQIVSSAAQTDAVTLNCVVRKAPFPGMHP
jgi:hypothetical protein